MKNKHENNIVRYAQDCLRHKDPWTKWFYQYDGNDDDDWYPCEGPPTWDNDMRYRRDIDTRIVESFEFPVHYKLDDAICNIYLNQLSGFGVRFITEKDRLAAHRAGRQDAIIDQLTFETEDAAIEAARMLNFIIGVK